MLSGESLAALGVIITAIFTFLGTRFLAKSKQETTRDAAVDEEISKLRGLTWQHLEALQKQILTLKEELEGEKDYNDELRDHIYLALGPPPPLRKKLRRVITNNPIDLTQEEPEETSSS